MAATHGGYYLPHGSHWPITGSIAIFTLAVGTASYFQGAGWGPWVMLTGFAILVFMMFGWLGTVIGESVAGSYNEQVDRSFRWGMSWFIFSEVMFFAAFFGALYYARIFSVPWLGGGDVETSQLLWDGLSLNWPTAGPGYADFEFEYMPAWPIPTINTILLLTSGVTITIAHHALKAVDREKLVKWMWATVALGVTFLMFQAFEFYEAWHHMNLTLHTGVYGSTFFMLTGFHGFHVTIGTIMLIVISLRCMKGHFTPENHFGFEGVAWYWHFVDVVWLGLYIFVYVLV